MKGVIREANSKPTKLTLVYDKVVDLEKEYEIILSLSGGEMAYLIELALSNGKQVSPLLMERLADIIKASPVLIRKLTDKIPKEKPYD